MAARSQKEKAKERALTGRGFDSLPDSQKERIFQELEGETPEQRRAKWKTPNVAERAMLNRIKKKMGLPKIGKGCKVVGEAKK